MIIYDCFIFFNELDLLELRLNVLNDSVDYFVIVESAITFQGEAKEFFFEKHKDRFAKFENKIIHFKVEKYEFDFANLPYIKAPQSADDYVLNKIYKFVDDCPHFDKNTQFWWGNDFFQRECIWRGLSVANPAPDDLILISDVDEIPSPEIIIEYKSRLQPETLLSFKQHEFCYYLNYYHNSDWVGTCCFLYGEYQNVSLNSIRFSTKRNEGLAPQIVDNGGWHFTSIGSVEAIKKKIQSWGHKEFNTSATLNSVEYNVRHGYDIFRRHGFGKLVCLPIERSMFPAYLVENVGKFENIIGPEIERESVFQRLFYIAYFKIQSKLNSVLSRIGVH
jgi:beta-1,4-mannosyl-glycoprotein beta-1,4-N-acetylglucosaminyltransferase